MKRKQFTSKKRRKVLNSVIAGSLTKWATPVILSVPLPVHAQSTATATAPPTTPAPAPALICGVDYCPTTADFMLQPILHIHREGDVLGGNVAVEPGYVTYNTSVDVLGCDSGNFNFNWQLRLAPGAAFQNAPAANVINNGRTVDEEATCPASGICEGNFPDIGSILYFEWSVDITPNIAGLVCAPVTLGVIYNVQVTGTGFYASGGFQRSRHAVDGFVITATPVGSTILSGQTSWSAT